MTITDNDAGVTYEPMEHGGAVGFKCTKLATGQVSFIYLNPSGGSDDGVPTVFLYIDDDEPTFTGAVHHYTLFREPRFKTETIYLVTEENKDHTFFRVTVNTTKEQYEYQVRAADQNGAERQGIDLAVNDGMRRDASYWINTEAM